MSARILCVDDDTNILAGFQRNLRRQFNLDVAAEGSEGLRMLTEQGPYAAVVADMQMPGMNGVQLLAEARRQTPDTIRIMLTGNADQRTAMEAVNQGHIFRFLIKPCSTEDLAAALQAAVAQHRLVLAERDLLERTLNGSVALLTDVLSLVEPASFGRGQALRTAMISFAKDLGVASRWDLEMGAMLSELGWVTLPPHVLIKVRSGLSLTGPERDLLTRIPEFGANLLARIPRLEPVAQIVRYQAKCFDGTGFPDDKVAASDIPIGSRILKVLGDLSRLEAEGKPKDKALELMGQREGWYDPQVLAAAHRCFDVWFPESPANRSEDVAVRLKDLHPGQTLLEDVTTVEGLLIVKARTLLSPPLLERLRNFATTAGVQEPILVRMPSPPGLPSRAG